MVSAETFVYLQFATFSKDGNLTLLYNEAQNNIDKDVDAKARFSAVQKSEVCAATISKGGTVQRVKLLEDCGKTIGLLHKVSILSPGSFLIQLEKLNFASMSTDKIRYEKITVD